MANQNFKVKNGLEVAPNSSGIGTILTTNSSGNVGVGTTNPTSKLTVTGNTSLETLRVSGISTLGITSTTQLTAINLNVSGITTLGFTSATNLNVSGIITTNNLNIQQLSVAGLTTSSRFISTISTGTAPITVASTTKVTNLNSDLLDDQDGSYYLDLTNATGTLANARLSGVYTGASFNNSIGICTFNSFSGSGSSLTSLNASQLSSGTVPNDRLSGVYTGFTGIAASGIITSSTFVSTASTGTSPISVASTTKVTNLNSDLLDDQDGSYYLDLTNATGTLDSSKISGTVSSGSSFSELSVSGIVTASRFISTVTSGSPFTVSSSSVVNNLNAQLHGGYDISGVLTEDLDFSKYLGTVNFNSNVPVTFGDILNPGTFDGLLTIVNLPFSNTKIELSGNYGDLLIQNTISKTQAGIPVGNIYIQSTNPQGSLQTAFASILVEDTSVVPAGINTAADARLYFNNVEQLRTINGAVAATNRLLVRNTSYDYAPNSDFAVQGLSSFSNKVSIGMTDGESSRLHVRMGSQTDLVPMVIFESTDTTVTSNNILTDMKFSGDTSCTGGFFIRFQDADTVFGGVAVASTNTISYTGTSDYRLKTNIQPMKGSVERVLNLNPCTFDWINGGSSEGFIAHELQEVVPQAVTGAKDQVDSQGNILPQGVDPRHLVPVLTSALQEALKRIEQLEIKVSELESLI